MSELQITDNNKIVMDEDLPEMDVIHIDLSVGVTYRSREQSVSFSMISVSGEITGIVTDPSHHRFRERFRCGFILKDSEDIGSKLLNLIKENNPVVNGIEMLFPHNFDEKEF